MTEILNTIRNESLGYLDIWQLGFVWSLGFGYWDLVHGDPTNIREAKFSAVANGNVRCDMSGLLV